MANMLDRDNQHLLLEKTDNTNNSFIANINKLAAKLNIIIEAVGLFDENVIPVLEEIAELDLGAAIEDLEKGSYLGNRKIDINLLYNMTDVDADTDEAIATEAWTDPTKIVMYSGATALFKDGTSIYIPFMFDKNPVNISTHADLLLQLNTNQEFLGKLTNTLMASFAHPVVGEILRIYDVDGVASNLDRLTLHAATGSFKEASTAYYWTKSTSALQTLAMRVGDINMIGSNIESFIALANNVIQLVNLQERIPELVDTYTNGVANGDVTLYNNLTKLIALHTNLDVLQTLHTNINKIISVEGNIDLIQEVADNIVPNLTAILSSYTHAVEAKNAANTAREYSNSASISAATALAKANEIKKVTVGSTTTAVAGSSASVVYDTNSGKFHFVIPQGVKGDKGDAFTINARGTTEQRSLYDNQVAGFSFFDLDTNQLYLKITNATGNWSDGIQFGKGDPGEDGAAGVGVSSITFTSTTDPSGNPGQPDAVDTYSINYTDGNVTTFTIANGNSFFSLSDSTSKVYVSKQGNDLNNGLSIEKPKATIASAITAANALLANAPRAVVEVMDASRYQEDITIPQNIMVRGNDATLEGTVILNNNSYFDMYAHYARVLDSVMVSKVGNSHSYYKVVVQDAGGTLGSLTGCTNLRNSVASGILFAQIELQKVTYIGVKEETTTGVGHIHVRIKDMYLAADNAIGIYGVGTTSDIVGTVDHILMSDSLSNTRGIVFDSANGSLNITSNKIAATTAYDVTSGKVKLSCPDITGITNGNASVVLTTGNLSDLLDLDSSTTPASSKAIKTVNDKLSITQTELQEVIDNTNPALQQTPGIICPTDTESGLYIDPTTPGRLKINIGDGLTVTPENKLQVSPLPVVDQPTIVAPTINSCVVSDSTLPLASSNFSSTPSGGAYTHDSSQWKITGADGRTVWDSGWDSTNLTSKVGPRTKDLTLVPSGFNFKSTALPTLVGYVTGCEFFNNAFFAVDDMSYTYKTTDPSAMTLSASAESYTYLSVAASGGKIIKFGNNGYISTSADGATWNTLALAGRFNDYCFGNTKYVLVGEGKICYSTNLTAWTTATTAFLANYYWNSITYGNGYFVATAIGAMAYSTDAVTWSIYPLSGSWRDIVYANNKFMAVGFHCIAYCTLPTAWVVQKFPGLWTHVTYGDGLFLVTAGTKTFAYSNDGVAWTMGYSPLSIGHSCYGLGRFVCCCSNDNCLTYSLMQSEQLWASVRHRSAALGMSQWSQPIPFTTTFE